VSLCTIKSLWPWHWRCARDTGVHLYEVCACGRRRVRRVDPSGWQPVDRGWVQTGEWRPRPERGPVVTWTGTMPDAPAKDIELPAGIADSLIKLGKP
jgi:hypothetical protein